MDNILFFFLELFLGKLIESLLPATLIVFGFSIPAAVIGLLVVVLLMVARFFYKKHKASKTK